MKNIINRNSKGQHHGYQERYFCETLWYRGSCKNSKLIDYVELHNWVKTTLFYIK